MSEATQRPGAAGNDPLVEASDLVRTYEIGRRLVGRPAQLQAVAGVSFALHRGETLAVVGESGSGKSTLGRMVLGLLAPTRGELRFEGTPLARLDGARRKAYRRDVQAVFQDTGASLNPRRRIADSIAIPLRYHERLRGPELEQRVAWLLDRVGLPHERFRRRYPHELSGGQRQRVGIARAIACRPKLVVADEPVSALDVSVRAQILKLMRELQDEMGMSYLFITHDLGVVRSFAHRVVVMYLGRVVEQGAVEPVFLAPGHPYTQALLRSTPRPVPPEDTEAEQEPALRGEIPSPMHPPQGCRFHPRCPFVEDRCRTEAPPERPLDGGVVAACHFAPDVQREFTAGTR